MRQVGDLEGRALAHRFLAYMVAQGVKGEARDEESGRYRLWVYDEDQLERAEDWLTEFRAAPNDKRFDAPALPGGDGEAVAAAVAARVLKPRVMPRGDDDAIPVTVALIALCVGATVLTLWVPGTKWIESWLRFSNFVGRDFPEIAHGQVWRLVTPALLHGGVMHIAFNMMWLYQLGGAVERTEGRLYFGVFAALLAVVCDVAQYLVSGPAFIGLSGVVYGLLSYTWIMGRRAPRAGYALSEQIFYVMVVWMVLCLIGIIPDVANTQHVVGLVAGLAWGALRANRYAIKRSR